MMKLGIGVACGKLFYRADGDQHFDKLYNIRGDYDYGNA